MKKILSLILAGLMTVSCAAFVAADDAAVEATTDPYQDLAIEFLETHGIYKGGEGLTNEDAIQRYQMALFVSRISTGWTKDEAWEDGTANDSTFEDIGEEPASKYLGALSYANQNGIIEGYSTKTFAPYDGITYRDALTMVVRTLGYKGLSYPWGNIEKAVELDLTRGVDAAYTDELTRGEVAVIIYNALFAETAKGGTLAKNIFGVDFGWQNVIVLSTDEYSLIDNTKDGAKVYADPGYIGFSTISETGVIGDKVYYIAADAFGLKDHAVEQAVGHCYLAMFEYANGSSIVELACDTIYDLEQPAVFNNGITDDEAVAYTTMPIKAFLDNNYKVVTKYNFENEKYKLGYTYDDLKVYGFSDVDLIKVDGHSTWIGIDANHNIVEWNDTDKKWEIAWFYNAELDRYYNYIVDKDGKDKDSAGKLYTTNLASGSTNVYIDWMDEKQFADWYKATIDSVVATYGQLNLVDEISIDGKAPYAKLYLYDLDDEATADVAYYKDYTLGIIGKDTTTYKCTTNANSVDHSAGVVMPAYTFKALDGGVVDYTFVEEGHAAHDSKTKGFGWITVDPSVTTFDETKLTAAGEVVLYNWNKTTGEIEIVKHIVAGTNDDKDSEIITGILQGYSTTAKTVTINGTSYKYDYPGLADTFDQADTKAASRYLIAAALDEQYMQYITATICDGYIVDTDLRGEDASNAIVVLDYAGISSDGYICVYGYKTSDLKLSVFKINSFNGWKKGDYRYYPENADADKAFEAGALYTIKSFDKETSSYGVYTENVDTVLEGAKAVRISFENGYRVVKDAEIVKNGTSYKWELKKDADGKDIVLAVTPVTTGDRYVVIDGVNIYTHTGKLANSTKTTYTIDALMVAAEYKSASMILYTPSVANLGEIVNGWTIDGFNRNAYEVGYVVYMKDAAPVNSGYVWDAAYDEAIADWYLLGSTQSNVRVFNLLTGNYDDAVNFTNIDLVPGCVYKTIGGAIIGKLTTTSHDIIDTLIDVSYLADETKYDLSFDKYIVAKDKVLTKATLTEVDLALALGLINNKNSVSQVEIAKNLIHDDYAKKLFTWKNVDGWDWYEDHDTDLVLTALTLEDNKTYNADIIYEVATGKVVIYVKDSEIKVGNYPKAFTNDGATGNEAPIVIGTHDYTTSLGVRLFEEYTVTGYFGTEDCAGDLKDLKLNTLKLYYKAKATDGDYDAAIECGDTGCALHDLMANSADAFGVNYNKTNLSVEVKIDNGTGAVVVPATAYTYKFDTTSKCELAHQLVITFKDGYELNEDAANYIRVTVKDAINNTENYSVIKLEANYYTAAGATNEAFEKIVGSRDTSAASGAIDLNRPEYDQVSDKVVVID